MEKIIIKSSEIEATEVSQAIKELAHNNDFDLDNRIRKIAQIKNWSKGDTIEAIASHIVYTDEDFVIEVS